MDHSAQQPAHAQTTTLDPAVWWGEADYELRERAYAPIHERLINRVDPRQGERVLDVACGLGAIAARAARRGADVTAIDLAPNMIERASARPEPVDWQIGDCQSLPFEDDSFDVVVSSFGVIFAPDPHRAAAELSRVCRGRLAFTAWIGEPGRDLWQGTAPICGPSRLWSSETGAAHLLPTFDLVAEEGVWWLRGGSGRAIWSWVVRTSPTVRARLEQLSRAQARHVRAAWIRRYENFRINDTIHIPQMYLLSTGHKQTLTAPARGDRSGSARAREPFGWHDRTARRSRRRG
jgi:SAM-dependent methyltransferase